MNYWIDSIAGDAGGDGSRKSPFQTYAQLAAASPPISGDTVWIRGTLTEIVTPASGVTLRRWGKTNFKIDGGSARANCLVIDSVSDVTVIGGDFDSATGDGALLDGIVDNIRFLGCSADSNGADGFGCGASAQGSAFFLGCTADLNGSDGFSAEVSAKFCIHDCTGTQHAGAAFHTSGDATMFVARSYAGTNSAAFLFENNSGTNVVVGCSSFIAGAHIAHIPTSTSIPAGSEPQTLAWANLISAGGALLATSYGIRADNGAAIYDIHNSIVNVGDSGTTYRCYSVFAGANNSGGAITSISRIASADSISSNAFAFLASVANPASMGFWGYNLLQTQSGDRYVLSGVDKTINEWLGEASSLEASSSLSPSALFSGSPGNEADLYLGRLASGSFWDVVPPIQEALDEAGISNIRNLLLSPFPEGLHAIYNSSEVVRNYPLPISYSNASIDGSPFDQLRNSNPGAFHEGSKTLIAHRGLNSNQTAGALILAGYDPNGAALTRRVNRRSVAGDSSRSITITRAKLHALAVTVPCSLTFFAGVPQAGKPIGFLVSNSGDEVLDLVGPPGEDIYIQLSDPGVSSPCFCSIEFREAGHAAYSTNMAFSVTDAN